GGYGIFGTELSETEETAKAKLQDAQNFANKNKNVLYVTDSTTGKLSPEVRLRDDKFYVFDKNKLIGKQSYDTKVDAEVRVEDIGLNP
ncbi:MAG: hypothetical protein ACO3UU_01635, partial [Minisyncoccia bacterium]